VESYTLIFGKKHTKEEFDRSFIRDLLDSANERAVAARDIPIDDILEILDRVGKKWADESYRLRKNALKILPNLIGFSVEMVEQGLNAISHICNRENLEKRLHGELGGKRALEDWLPRPNLLHDVKAIPRGPVLHMAAGNVFVGAVDSLVCGIITKNANILKMSHADPVFPMMFLESLKECDPKNYIWKNQALLFWKGGDDSIEIPLLESDLTVVFWGGKEALMSVRSKIGHNTRLIENGPRYSFAICEGHLVTGDISDQVIEGLAYDLCRWDQQACSSPHIVYVIDSNNNSVFNLMTKLSRKLENISKKLPLGELTFDEKVEIRKVRELATFAELKGSGKLICPSNFDFSLIFEEDPVFKISCLNRTLFFKRVKSLPQLMREITPISSYLQTIGLFISPMLRKICEPQLLAAGAKRLTEWGGMSAGRDGAPHEGSFMLSRLIDWVDREYESSKEAKIRKLFTELEKSKYYSKLLADEKGRKLSELSQLPLLDRDTFYKNSPPLSRDILTGPLTDAYVYASGGTSGEPKYAFYSNEEYRRVTDVLTFIYRTAGLNENDVVGNLFLAGNLWTSFNVAGRAIENIGCLNLPIGGLADIDNMIKYLRTFQATAVVGLPSIIVKLAEVVKKQNSSLHIPKILYGGEHLRPQTADFLKDVLKCEWIRSAGYACVDTGPIGYQCPHLKGGVHHELDTYQHVEILSNEDSEPCPANEPGEIVVTNLDRTLMPIVRYRTGDLGRRIVGKECACGFNGNTFELLGRCDDLLVIGGMNIMPVDISQAVAGLSISPNFQIVARLRKGKDVLLLRFEAENPIPFEEITDLLKRNSFKFAEALNDDWLILEVEWFKPGTIPRNTRTGKLKTVIDERQ